MLVVAGVALVGGIALAAGPPDGLVATDLSRGNREQLERVQREEALRQAFRDSEAGRTERAESRSAYASLSDDQALAIGRTRFRSLVEAPPLRWPSLRAGEEVDHYLNPQAAIVRGPDGARSVMQSNLPLRGETPDGSLRPIDLDLDEIDGVYMPKSSIARVRLPKTTAVDVRFPEQRLGIGLDRARTVDARRSSSKLFFANALEDTDFVVEAKPLGAELSLLLRSPASPRNAALAFDMAPGDRLRLTDDSDSVLPGSAEVVDGKARVALVAPPLAVDAQGKNVEVHYRVEGTRLVLDVADDPDVAYPVMVDPSTYVYDNNGGSTCPPGAPLPCGSPPPTGYTWPNWLPMPSKGFWAGAGCPVPQAPATQPWSMCKLSDGALVVSAFRSLTNGQTYSIWDYGSWAKAARSGTYIWRFDVANASHWVNSTPAKTWIFAQICTTNCAAGIPGYWWSPDDDANAGNPSTGSGPQASYMSGYPIRAQTVYMCYDPSVSAHQGCDQSATGNGNPSINNAVRMGLIMTGGFPTGDPVAAFGGAATLSADNFPPKVVDATHAPADPSPSTWVDAFSDTVAVRAADNNAETNNAYTVNADTNANGNYLQGVGLGTVSVSAATGASNTTVGSQSTCGSTNVYDTCPQVKTFDQPGISYNAPEGVTTYTPRATDIVGNTATGQTWSVKVDKTAPTIATGGRLVTGSAWINDQGNTLTVDPNDAFSGVQNEELQVKTEGETAASSVIARDAFGRSATSAWGAADRGGAWELTAGTETSFSVDGDLGAIQTGSGVERYVKLPPAVRTAGVDATVRVVLPTTVPTAGGAGGFLVLRDQTPTGGGNHYRVGLWRDAAGHISVRVRNGGGAVLFTDTDTGLVYAPGDTYYLRVRLEGTIPTTVRARVWRGGTAEPTTWVLSGTDGTAGPQRAGRVGLRSYQDSNSTPLRIAFDDLKATSLDTWVTKGYRSEGCDTTGCPARPAGAPVTFTWDTTDYQEGARDIRGVARDPVAATGANDSERSNHVVASAPRTVKLDRTPPGVANPRGALTSGGWVNVPATATVDTTDNYSGVRRAELHIDGSATAVDPQSPTCSPDCPLAGFNPTLTWTPGVNDANGRHTVQVKAVDDATNPRDYPTPAWSVGLDRLQPVDFIPTGSLWNGESSSGELGRRNHTMDFTATDAHSGTKRVDVTIDDPDSATDTPISLTPVNGSCSATQCPTTGVQAHFEWNSSTVSYNRVRVVVRVTDLAGNYREKSKILAHDSVKPTLSLSGPMAPPIASGRALHMEGDDTGTGIQRFDVWLDPPQDAVTAVAPTQRHTKACSPTCLNHDEDDWVLPDTTTEGTHKVVVRVYDDAGLYDEKRFEVHVVSLFPSSRTKLGLEHYFQYDDIPSGGGTKMFVNAETGNAVWHGVPIVNPGRGLSTVVNLTYNSQDRGGVLGSSLGHIPVLDLSGANISQDLPGLSYAEAGVGFSLGISAPTRLNEPLGGTLVAQAVEEGTQLPEYGPLPQIGDMRITMTDADGTVHSFQRSGSQWVGDPGLDMHLRRYRNGGTFLDPIDDKWAMTRPDGVTHFFDNLGYLTKTQDRNGNALTYHYQYYDALTGDVTKTLAKATGGTVDVNLCKPVELHGQRLGKQYTLTTDPASGSVLGTPQRVYCAKRVDKVTDAAGRDLSIEYNDYNGDLLGLDDVTPPVEMRADFPGLIGGKAGRIKKITDHANRTYTFTYDNDGYLSQLVEVANAQVAKPRVTNLYYEDWRGNGQQIGQDRQLTRISEVIDGVARQTTSMRYVHPDDRQVLPGFLGVPGTFAEPRQVCGVNRRADWFLLRSPQPIVQGEMCRARRTNKETTYRYEAPVNTSPRRFKVNEVIEAGPTGGSDPIESANTTHELDSRGRPTAVIGPLDRRTDLTWNDNDNTVASMEEAKGTADASRTDLTYDQTFGTGVLLSKKTYPDYPDTTSRAQTTTFTYQFSTGLYRSSASGVNDASSPFVADLTQIDKPRAGTGSSFKIKQDAAGNYLGNVEKAWPRPGQAGAPVTMTYDDVGQLMSSQSGIPGEPATQYPTHDPNGLPTSAIDPRTKKWAYEYDAVGNLRYAVDPRGNTTAIADGNPFTTKLDYDEFDRLRTEKLPFLSDGSDPSVPRFRTRSHTYDRNGNVLSETDGETKTTTVTYTAMELPRRVVAPGRPGRSEVTDYVYDDANRLIARVDPKGTGATPATISDQNSVCTGTATPPIRAYTTRYCLDAADRRVAEVRTALSSDLQSGDQNAQITAYGFDARDNEVGMIDPNRTQGMAVKDAVAAAATGPRFKYAYDRVDRRTDQRERVVDSSGTLTAVLRTHYDYDANDNPMSVLPPRAYSGGSNTATNPSSADTSFAVTKFYDLRDLVTAVKTPTGCSAYGRREDGRVVTMTKPRGTEIDTTGNGPGGDCSPADPYKYKYFTTTTTYGGQGNLTSRSIPYAPNQYGRADSEFASRKVIYTPDDVGNPTQVTDPRGHTFANTFYDSGELRSTGRPSFYQLDWGEGDYRAPDPGRRFKAADANGDFELVDGGPQLSEVEDGRSRNARKSGDLPALPDSQEAGNFGKVERQDLGDLLPDAGATTFKYDGELRLKSVTDAAGAQRAIDYDDAGRVLKKTWPLESGNPIQHTFAYDPDGNLESYNDGRADGQAADHLTAYRSDGFERRIEEDAPGGASSPTDTFATEVTKYGYDSNGNLRSRQTPGGPSQVFKFAYDSVDRLIDERNPMAATGTTPNGEHWAYGYDANGNLDFERSPRYDVAATAEKPKFETTFTYDRSNRMTRVKAGYSTRGDRDTDFVYDANDNRTSITRPGSALTNGGSVARRGATTEFDGRDLPWRESTATVDGGSRRTKLKEYDANGSLARVVDPKGVNSTTLLPKVPQTPTTTLDDATWHATVREYDDDDQVTQVRQPWSKPATGGSDGVSDPQGPQDAEAGGDSRRLIQTFQRETAGGSNPLRRITSIVAPHESTETLAPKTSYTYFQNGWIATQSDQKMARPTSTKTIETDLITYGYDKTGNQTSWRTSSASTGNGRVVTRTFWPDGTLQSRTASKGVKNSSDVTLRSYKYFYDRNHALARMDDFDVVLRNRDGTSPPTGSPDRTTNITRDAAERPTVVNETWPAGRDTTFAYDAAGNVVTRKVDGKYHSSDGSYDGADAKVTTFDYDPLDRETRLEVDPPSGNNGVTTTSWWDSGDMEQRNKPNGTVENYSFNPRGEITEKRRDPSGDDAVTQEYTYDGNGNRTKDERGTHLFDPRGQLVKWTRASTYGQKAGTSVSYDRTASGDIAKKVDTYQAEGVVGPVRTEFHYDGERLRSTDTTIPTELGVNVTTHSDYFHDDLGSVTKIVSKQTGPAAAPSDPPDGPPVPSDCADMPATPEATVTRYCFDEFERMIASRGEGVPKPSNYVYDGLDRRDRVTVETTTGASRNHDLSYVGTSRLLSRETDSDRTVKKYDYDSRGKRLGQGVKKVTDLAPVYRSYADDANGSVVGLEQDDGKLGAGGQDTYLYDPYGEPDQVIPTGSDPSDTVDPGLSPAAKDNPFRFEGFYYDSGVKTYDMQAREYRPDIGRFLSQDRFESAAGDQFLQSDPLTQNRYAFAGGNPVNNVEFDGHQIAGNEGCGACGTVPGGGSHSAGNEGCGPCGTVPGGGGGSSGGGGGGSGRPVTVPPGVYRGYSPAQAAIRIQIFIQSANYVQQRLCAASSCTKQDRQSLTEQVFLKLTSPFEDIAVATPGQIRQLAAIDRYVRSRADALEAQGIENIGDAAGFFGKPWDPVHHPLDTILFGASALRPLRGLEGAARGGAGPVMIGQAGERAVRALYKVGDKVPVNVDGRIRIPDGLTASTLSEIKNVRKLSYTAQLRDFAKYAQATERTFNLYIRRSTVLSGPLQRAVVGGSINLRYIP